MIPPRFPLILFRQERKTGVEEVAGDVNAARDIHHQSDHDHDHDHDDYEGVDDDEDNEDCDDDDCHSDHNKGEEDEMHHKLPNDGYLTLCYQVCWTTTQGSEKKSSK